MMRTVLMSLIFISGLLFAKTTVVSHSPVTVQAKPTNQGAFISWQMNLADTVLSFNNSKAYGIWSPHLNQALGCIFDLSEFPNATLEQIDFLHYSRQKMHGPYYYTIWFFDMDSAKVFYKIDSLLAGDSYDYPRFEVGVPLGSIPARNRVGIFIEGLSSPDNSNAFPALMTDSSDYVPGVSYYLADVNDPFLESDPNYTNFYELKDVANGATNLVLDLWINTGSHSSTNTLQKAPPIVAARPQKFADLFQGVLSPSVAPLQSQSILEGFYIYRGDSTSDQFELIAEVSADVREYTDEHPLMGSTYFYAVSSFNDISVSVKKMVEYFQPPILSISEARKDVDQDFVPDRMGEIVAIRGSVVSPNFSGSLQIFVNDKDAGIMLYSPKVNVNLEIGDSLFVYGKVTQYKGLTELMIDSAAQIQIIGKTTPQPQNITLAEVGEMYEGRLVKIRDLHLVNPGDWPAEGQNGTQVKVTDGQDTVALFIDKDTDLDGWSPPTGEFTLQAIVDQYTSSTPANDGYELRPRSQQDFSPQTSLQDAQPIAQQFDLLPCFPNPFNPFTTIVFSIPQRSQVQIQLFNIRGQHIRTLLNAVQNAGKHMVKLDGSNLATGIYLVKFSAGNYTETQKIVLLK